MKRRPEKVNRLYINDPYREDFCRIHDNGTIQINFPDWSQEPKVDNWITCNRGDQVTIPENLRIRRNIIDNLNLITKEANRDLPLTESEHYLFIEGNSGAQIIVARPKIEA